MEHKTMTCIICPMGCQLTIETEESDILSISGNTCPRGIEYAKRELTDQRRTLTSTVSVSGGELPLVPVKTAQEIPSKLLLPSMEIIRRCHISAPVKRGDIIIPDILGTGIPVIACADVPVTNKETASV